MEKRKTIRRGREMQKPERRKIGVSGADTYGQIADKNYNIGLAAMEKYYKWRMVSLVETLSEIIARKIAKRIGGSNEQTKQD